MNFRSFFDRDLVKFSELEEDIRKNRFPDSPDITAFISGSVISMLSERFSNGVPELISKVFSRS